VSTLGHTKIGDRVLDAYPLWTVPPERRAEVTHHSARPGWPEVVDTFVIHYTGDSPAGKPPPKAIRWWRFEGCAKCLQDKGHSLHQPGAVVGWSIEGVGKVLPHPFRPVEASAHYVIERDGTVWQAVPLDRAAWHVATPGWNGRSIGIELANLGPPEEFPAAQIAALVSLITELRAGFHPRGGWKFIGHEDVQGNRTDPGPLFPWGSMPLPRST
jgi:hypothetical protein